MKRQFNLSKLSQILLVLVLIVSVSACGKKKGSSKSSESHKVSTTKKQKLTVIGSDTMVIMAQKWAEVYMKENKGKVSIQVSGGGSGVGIAALINGRTDLANASRGMKDKERKKIKAKGWKLKEIRTAVDGLTVYLNNGNSVAELSFSQLAGIYTGKIKNWKEVGGNNAPIITYGRENSSGTYGYLKKNVLKGKDFAAGIQTLPGTSAIVNAVLKDPNGIGYGGKAYLEGIKAVKIKKGDNDTAYAPVDKDIDKYPLTRPLFIYTLEKNLKAKPMINEYISWILNKEKGQKVVKDVGYYPITK